MTARPKIRPWRLGFTLVRYLGWAYVASAVLWIAFHSMPLGWGAFSSMAVDRIAGESPGPVVWVLAALAGVGVARGIVFYGGVLVWTFVWNHLVALMRANVLSHVVRGPGRGRIPDSPGEAISRFRDDVYEYTDLLDLWLDTAGAALFGVGALALMARIDLRLAVVSALPMTAILIVMQLASPKIRQYRRETRRTTSAVTGFIGEIFSSALAVKLGSAVDGAVERFEVLSEARRKAAIKDRLVVELTDAVNANLVAISIGLVLVLGAGAMRSGEFTVGEFTLFVVYLDQLAALPRRVGRLIARTKRATVSIARLEKMIDGAAPEAIVEHNPVHLRGPLPDVPQPEKTDADRLRRLSVRGLTYVYPGSDRGIRDISFDITPGTFTVICGRIGSGKTTLLRTLLGLVEPQAGEVRWNGAVVRDPQAFFVPPRCAYTPQVPRLFSESLRDNVLMGLEEDELDESIRLAVFEDDLDAMREGLDTVVGPRGVRLSGGQIQRAAAARMFVRDAELLVFDDLSSALDVETERTLWERVFDRRGATCLVVSHRRAALRRADRIVVLANGTVEASGHLDGVLERSPELQRLWTTEGEPARQD